MKKIFLILFFFTIIIQLPAQQLAAFNDYLNKFWVFEAGSFQQIEYIPVLDYQVGGLGVAYIDNRSNLKLYRNGEVETLISGAPIKYLATDYLIAYSLYEQLSVWEIGEKTLLSTECDGYIIQDSLIAWHNRVVKTTQVYYNGEIYTIEDGLVYNPVEDFRAGDNTLAWVQKITKQFKLFYRGEIIILNEFINDLEYKAGRDIVAYINKPDMAFNVFYRGEDYEIESFNPKSFQVGDDMLAYVDNMGQLKVFDGGKVTVLSTYEPTFYKVVDRVVVFEEQGFFKTFCNGNVYVVERFIPDLYRIDYNTIAYLDQNNFVKAFRHCESVNVSFEIVKEISLIRDLIIYVTGVNQTKVYFMGQVFEY